VHRRRRAAADSIGTRTHKYKRQRNGNGMQHGRLLAEVVINGWLWLADEQQRRDHREQRSTDCWAAGAWACASSRGFYGAALPQRPAVVSARSRSFSLGSGDAVRSRIGKKIFVFLFFTLKSLYFRCNSHFLQFITCFKINFIFYYKIGKF
jgi:hypothetical protein